MLILTSFSDINNFPDYKVYSITSKQPNDIGLSEIKYDRLPIFIPKTEFMGLEREIFSEKYLQFLKDHQEEIKNTIRDVLFSSVDTGVLLCCWCNENFHKGNNFFCHRVIIRDFINNYVSYVSAELR